MVVSFPFLFTPVVVEMSEGSIMPPVRRRPVSLEGGDDEFPFVTA
jgi:hypothetical protein